jgi:large subunit ribosomal protein L25
MATHKLQVTKRDVSHKSSRAIRRKGSIPGVLYGHGIENVHVAVDGTVLHTILPDISSSTLIALHVESEEHPRSVLVSDVQRHPLTGEPIHVDFHQVTMTEKIRTEVPIEFEGVSPAVKDLGGTLVKTLDEVEVEALPQDLPEHISVDISLLKTFNEHIRIKDLSVDSSVHIFAEEEDMIAYVEAPRTEEELEELEEETTEETPAEVKTEAEEKREEKEKEQEETGEKEEE